MTTAGFQGVDRAASPALPAVSGDSLARWRETAGLTWQKLAGSINITEREVFQWRADNRPRSGPVHRALVVLARDLRAGCDRITVGDHDHDHDGEGG